MKKCELCSKVARMYCESDEASLCWDCDSRVHAANFLVAKHTRTLLCNSCQSPTPWTGSGPKLGPTVSVCVACDNRDGTEGEDEDEDDDDDDDSENGDLVHEDEDEDDDGENQVVPLSLPPSSSSASASASTSASTSLSYSSEESSAIRDGLFASSSEENASFFNHVNGREEEENGGKKVRSWRWR